jgi:site-specific recombinase XerD
MHLGDLTFLGFYTQFLEDFKKKVKSGTRVSGTYCKYEALSKHLKNFIRRTYRRDDVAFSEVNCKFIEEFDYYLRCEVGIAHNTIWMYMIALTTFCRLALSRKHLSSNPFSEYRNTRKEKDRGFLLKSELEQIINFSKGLVYFQLFYRTFFFRSSCIVTETHTGIFRRKDVDYFA